MAQTNAQDTFRNAASSLPGEVPAGLPRSGGCFDGDPELPGKPGPGCEFLPVRTCQSCGCRLPPLLSGQKQLLSCCFLGTVLALQGACKKLWDKSEPGFSVRYTFRSFTEQFLGPLACVRVGHPGVDKILPAPVLGLLPAWSGGPRRYPVHCDSCYWNASLHPWPVTYSGLLPWCSASLPDSPGPDVRLGSVALLSQACIAHGCNDLLL